MSSVLDIRYKRPDSLRASVSGSALGATGHLEGSLKIGRTNTQRLRYLVGARYKTNQYLLNSSMSRENMCPTSQISRLT